jgi:protein TonB
MNYIIGFIVSLIIHAVVILALFAGRANLRPSSDAPKTIDISAFTFEKNEPMPAVQPPLPKQTDKKPAEKPKAVQKVTAPPPVAAKQPLKQAEPKVVSDFGQKEYVPVIVPEPEKLPPYTGEGTVGAKQQESAAQTGTGTTASSASTSAGKNSGEVAAEYMSVNLKGIRKRIYDRLNYPSSAKRMGMKGSSVVKFRIHRNGSVDDVSISRTSGHEILDEAAKQAILDAAPYPSPSEAIYVVLSVNFSLR